MAGQIAGLVNDIRDAADIIREMFSQAERIAAAMAERSFPRPSAAVK
jgi:NAD(P)H-dependent flavin oxidoreductase YrpB (nitropropane dioxygenase family)